MNLTVEMAKFWRDEGICPIPMRWRSKRPIVAWKIWQKSGMLPNDEQLDIWFNNRFGQVNVGVIIKGFTVLDFDDKTAFYKWQSWIGFRTRMVTTSRGVHVYVAQESETYAFEYGGVHAGEVKGTGLVAVPPSMHESGARYEWRMMGPIMPLDDLHVTRLKVPDAVYEQIGDSARVTPENGGVAARIKDTIAVTYILGMMGVKGFVRHRGNTLLCRCPFHKDETPSMQVWPDEARAYCYSPQCVAHRKCDVITLYAMGHGLSDADAVREMARLYLE